jgi:hypothetical protein
MFGEDLDSAARAASRRCCATAKRYVARKSSASRKPVWDRSHHGRLLARDRLTRVRMRPEQQS